MTAPQLELLVLAGGPLGMAAIDLASGALVRVSWPAPGPTHDPYTVVRAAPGDGDLSEALSFAPEALSVADAPVATGRLRGRAVERLVRRVVHPDRQPLFGFAGPTAPFWTLGPDRPSIAVIEPERGPEVVRRPGGSARCRFRWRRLDHDLPLDDRIVGAQLTHPTAECVPAATLRRMLGWEPRRLLIALTPPRAGTCYKVVAGILPRP